MKPSVLVGLMMWLQSFLVWTAGHSPYVPLIATCAGTLRWVRPYSLRVGRRLWIAALLVTGVIAIAATRSGPLAKDLDGHIVTGSITLLLANYLLLVQSLELFRPSMGGVLPGYFPSLSLLTIVCAFNQTIEPSDRALFLTLAIASAVGCGALFQAAVRRQAMVRQGTITIRHALMAGVLVGSAFGAWTMATAWETAVTRVQVLLPGWMAGVAGHNRAARSYVRTGTLKSITSEKQTDPMHVALRVYATKAPGYLRGRVFDTYFRSQWHSPSRRRGKWNRLEDKQIQPSLRQTPDGIPEPKAGQSLFAIHAEADGPFVRMEIHNDPQRNEMFFTPLATSYLQGEGTFVAIDEHRAVYTGIDSRVPYTTYVAREARQSKLSDALRMRLLERPADVGPDVIGLANQVCREAQTPQQKIDAVVAFFQNNFVYESEGVDLPRDVEPLSYFLLNRPAAHCEFFASGAVTLLRCQGVPSRYVTGYVVTELEPEYGDYWLARNRNAHAWAEAYDENRKRWVLVEATPGMSVPREEDSRRTAEADVDPNPSRWAGDLASDYPWLDKRWLSRRWAALGQWLKYPLMLCGVGAMSAWVIWQARSRRRCPPDRRSRQAMYQQRMLADIDRRLRRRNLTRHRHETLHQFAHRLRTDFGEDEWLRRCAVWYLQYARARYGPEDCRLPAPPR